MLSDLTGAIPASDSNSPATSAESATVRIRLLGALEASLLRSQKALLRLDLEGIHRGTREQVGLVAELAAIPMRCAGEPTDVLAGEIRQGEVRTLQAARVQAALLARGRAKLRMLANMLAGPGVNYGPFPGRDWKPARVLAPAKRES